MDRIGVRPAHKLDIKQMAHTLGRAFHDDPVMAWMFPGATSRAWRLPRLFGLLIRYHHLRAGGCEVATAPDRLGAAALWDPPGRWQDSRGEQLLALPALLVTFGRRLAIGSEVLEAMQRVHPEEPHWYLAVIGSDPALRGKGFGQALMHSRLDRCDAEHSPAYLESSKPDNVPYYMRFGFEVTGEIALPSGGPPIWPMWRAAQ